MYRWIAALLVIAMGLAAVQSQPRGEPQEPVLQVTEEDGEFVWRLTRTGAVTLELLLSHYVDHSGGTLLFNPHQIRGEVTFTPPRGGAEYRGEEIDVLMLNALETFRFGIVERAPKTLAILPAAEMGAHAPTISIEELATVNAGRYYNCLVPLAHADANSITGMARNLTTRQGGMVQPIPSANVVLICDRCDRVRELVALVQEIDARLKPVVRFYEIPAEAAPADAVKLMQQLIPNQPGRENKFAEMPGKHGVIASAPAHVHTHIEAIVAAMK